MIWALVSIAGMIGVAVLISYVGWPWTLFVILPVCCAGLVLADLADRR